MRTLYNLVDKIPRRRFENFQINVLAPRDVPLVAWQDKMKLVGLGYSTLKAFIVAAMETKLGKEDVAT